MILHFKLRSLAVTETFILEQFKAVPQDNMAFAYLMPAAIERQTEATIWCNGIGSYISRLLSFSSQVKLIHVHFGSNAIFALPLLMRFRVPMVLSFYGHDASSFLVKWPKLTRFVCRYASKILALTETMKKNLIQAGLDSTKIEVFHPGIPEVRTKKKTRGEDPTLRLLMASSLREKKNHRLVLLALSKLKGALVKLRIAGTGPLENELRALSWELGIKVEFSGAFVTEEERQAHFLWADVLLHPSTEAANKDSEGLPFLILEAMQAGLPVVTSRHAGMELELRDSCFYVSESDPRELAELIKNWDRTKAIQKSTSGQELVKAVFSQTKNLQGLRNIYKSLCPNLVLPD